MEILSKTQLLAQKASFQKSKPSVSLSESINAHSQRNAFSSEVTIFLSHKHGETPELESAIALLSRFNVSVYVDWNDKGMPATTSGQTANRLKEKITTSKKFILLATEAAINSKWCNWELGFGDAKKYLQHIALLPIRNDYTHFSGTEYLNIYPVIGRRYDWSDDYYDVKFPDGSTIDLVAWLKA